MFAMTPNRLRRACDGVGAEWNEFAFEHRVGI